MRDMQVSVLMAVYNAAEFVREAVESILRQTYGELEFVVVDDGSTDESPQIVGGYGDGRIHMVRQGNRGLAAALNVGLSHCSHPIVVRMDADDVSPPNRIRDLMARWQEAGCPDVFGSAAQYIDSQGRRLWTVTVPTMHDDIVSLLRRARGMPVIHPSVLFRRDCVLSAGGYDEFFRRNGEDFELWLRMAEGFRFGNTDEPLLDYRLRSGQTSSRVEDGGGSWWRLLALQKAYLRIEGREGLWLSKREELVGELWRRFQASRFAGEAVVGRRLSEARVGLYSGDRGRMVRSLAAAVVANPRALVRRILGRTGASDLGCLVLQGDEIGNLGHGP
jgi:glycosyltransferase involved in cell wall biosynthesis